MPRSGRMGRGRSRGVRLDPRQDGSTPGASERVTVRVTIGSFTVADGEVLQVEATRR